MYPSEKEPGSLQMPMNKENLKYLVTKIHKTSIEYIRALSEKTENIYKLRDDLDTYYRDLYYYLKKLRVKYQVNF